MFCQLSVNSILKYLRLEVGYSEEEGVRSRLGLVSAVAIREASYWSCYFMYIIYYTQAEAI